MQGPERHEIHLGLYHEYRPQPLADRKGRHYREFGGKCLSLYRWYDGHVLRNDRITPGQLENIGRVLADLHTIGKSYKKGIENRFSFERVAHLYGEVRHRLLADPVLAALGVRLGATPVQVALAWLLDLAPTITLVHGIR